LADVVLALFQHLAQLDAFLDLAAGLELLDVIFSWEDGQLVGCVEGVHLLFRSGVEVSLTDYLTVVQHLAFLLPVVHEPTVAKVCEAERSFV
jgi:uncharacterized membrane protein